MVHPSSIPRDFCIFSDELCSGFNIEHKFTTKACRVTYQNLHQKTSLPFTQMHQYIYFLIFISIEELSSPSAEAVKRIVPEAAVALIIAIASPLNTVFWSVLYLSWLYGLELSTENNFSRPRYRELNFVVAVRKANPIFIEYGSCNISHVLPIVRNFFLFLCK